MTKLSALYKKRASIMDRYINDQSDVMAGAVDFIDRQIEEVGDPTCEFELFMQDKSRAEIGGLIAQYIAEANFESWDAWTQEEMTGIRLFLLDVMAFHNHRGDTNFATDDYYTGSHYLTKDMGPK
jgi:hypothetical protein